MQVLTLYQMIKFWTGPNSKHLQKYKKKSNPKIEICSGKGKNAFCGKKRKCWLPAFSPLPTMFSEGLQGH